LLDARSQKIGNLFVVNEFIPRFAVCLAAYNGMAYIKEQIDSILLQKNVVLQIFISVDQSSDGTEAFLAELALSEPRLTLLSFGQRFGSAGLNFYRLLRDVDFNGFDYLSFADQDDLWHPEKLWRARSLMVEQCAVGYSSNVTAFWPSGKTQVVKKAQPQRSLDYWFEAAGPGCTYVLTSDLALSLQKMVRGADLSLLRVGYHDWLIYAFARANNNVWVIDDWSSMQYRQHANNQIGVNAGWQSYWRRVRKLLSGHGFEQSLLIAKLVQASPTPVVQKGLLGGRLGYLWLALRAIQCRRKRLDQVWFFILCVLFAISKSTNRGHA
jgi:rhamnosyltransferase